jgi:hypothetical protein
VEELDVLNQEVDYIAEGERLLQQRRAAQLPAPPQATAAAAPQLQQPPPAPPQPTSAAAPPPAWPQAPVAPVSPMSCNSGICGHEHLAAHRLPCSMVQGSTYPVQQVSNFASMLHRHVICHNMQAAAGRADIRKPPAAPAPRPKLDATPFGKSGVSISKNLGRAPSGALSEEVSAASASRMLRVEPSKPPENRSF